MSSSTESSDVLCEQARECLKRRDRTGALALFEQAIAENVDHIPAHEGLAGLCFVLKQYDRSAELYRRLTLLNPRKIDSLVNLGAVCNRQGNYHEAVKVLRQALSRDRRCTAAYYNLGAAQRGLKQFSMAVSAYKEAIRLDPEMPECYAQLGSVLLEMGNHTQAVLNFERALRLKPNFPRAKEGLELARDQAEQAKKAISPFGRLVNMEEVEKRGEKQANPLRELSPQERFEDRNQVHLLAKDCENYALIFLQQIQEELSPVILELTRTVTEKSDYRDWGEEADDFKTAIRNMKQRLKALSQRTDALRAHEEAISKLQA